MPHLWMFLLQALTPDHEVLLIDGNTQPMSDAEIVRFVLAKGIGLVGIGATTRMIAKAYRVADAIRAMPMPSPWAKRMRLGRASSRTRPAACSKKDTCRWMRSDRSANPTCRTTRRSLGTRSISASSTAFPASCVRSWGTSRSPGRRSTSSESGRGCPYGCEFCTVTGFFGDSIRFRSNQSIVDELLLLKARARRTKGQVAVFFVDDNFAINAKRTKSLLRDMIAAMRKSPGWDRSAPTCCATKNS